MKNKLNLFLVIFIILLLLGCESSEQTVQVTSTQTKIPSPTKTNTPIPTSTPILGLGIESPIKVGGTSFMVDEVIVTGDTLSVILRVIGGFDEDFGGSIFSGARIKCENFEDNAGTLQQRDNYFRVNFSVPRNTVYDKCVFKYSDYSVELATFLD